MRALPLYLFSVIFLVPACKKSKSLEERWVEKSQRREVIVFRGGLPDNSLDETVEKSFYFQGRKSQAGQMGESGIYFYTVEGDSLVLKTRQAKYYFRLSDDGQWFKMGRFFSNPGGLDTLLIFEKQ